MKSQLTVYKASAGSGKTFTLAREYMTLVIENPMAYRTILAVTFTNKATEEMKQRILSQLYGIANSLPESEGYFEQIQKGLPHLGKRLIRKNAGEALHLLIHNYNYFRVMTIDTFFQSVLRNLARELDLTANLRIGLNDYQIEQQAVDEMIADLQETDKLLFWILDYIKENIDDDKSWNVIGQIKKFGENIFKDYYKENAEALNTCLDKEGFFKEFSDKMKKMHREAKEKLQEIAATFFDALEAGGYSAEDLHLKQKGIWSYFNKLKNGKYSDDDLCNATFEKCYIGADKGWVKAADVKACSPIYIYVCDHLYPILKYSEEVRPKLVKIYKSTELTIKHLNQLRLLGSIDRKVRSMNEEANRFLLSDTQTLLNALIQDSDSPFIFEKIGTQLDHVMIDEFQDTSTIQWKNFKVLLEETMSRENAGNLIVGDVKQSIYRWRSGDWRLLNNIDHEFAGGKTLDIQTLDTNYRSDRNIITFNNAFFTTAAKYEAEQLKEAQPEEVQQLVNAYADVCQNVPAKKSDLGYVEMQLLGGQDTTENMMAQTLETVRELDMMGVPINKIAILVRSNRAIQDIASYFMEHSEYKMVSDEAFRLDASQAVCTLVTALRMLAKPNDEIAKATIQRFCDTYAKEIAQNEEISEEGSMTAQKEAKEATESSNSNEFKYLVSQLQENRQALLQLPLFELTEKLYSMFCMDKIDDMKQQNAYIFAFYDKLNAFLADNGCDIEAFLAEWDANIHEKSIQCASLEGIRLITIHKSKGLEFDHIIMPFCDWQLEKSNTIWCQPQEEPYNELPLVPVDYSAKQMKQSIYEADYQHEHLQNTVDNLNLLYVAFTRASHSLFVLGKRGTASIRSNIIEQILPDVAAKLQKSGVPVELEGCGSDPKTDDIDFSYGELILPQEKAEAKASQNIFLQREENIEIVNTSNPSLPVFKQSNNSKDFVAGDENEEQQKYYIKMGTILHSVFANIKTTADLPKALQQLELDGVIYDDNVSQEKIEEMIKKRLSSPQVGDWFSGKWHVINECNILSPRPKPTQHLVEHRPDRVMWKDEDTIVVDFKFGKPKEEYHAQVSEYMSLLSEMGYPNVKGYLWYVYPNKVEEVTTTKGITE